MLELVRTQHTLQKIHGISSDPLDKHNLGPTLFEKKKAEKKTVTRLAPQLKTNCP